MGARGSTTVRREIWHGIFLFAMRDFAFGEFTYYR